MVVHDALLESMKQYGITDPVESVPFESYELNRFFHCEAYTEMSRGWKVGVIPDTPKDVKEDIKRRFFKLRFGMSPACLEECWGILEDFLVNPGFAAYYNMFPLSSDRFLRWLVEPAAIKTIDAFGLSVDLYGDLRQTPVEDGHWWWTRELPIMKYLRWRAMAIANLVAEQKERQSKLGSKQRIAVLGAGGMPEFSMVGYELDPEKQEVLAFDSGDGDKLIKVLAPKFNGAVDYRKSDIKKIVVSPEYEMRFDTVIMSGLMPYVPPQDRIPMIGCIRGMLAPQGQFIFDLQVEHWQMDWVFELFRWNQKMPMYLMPSIEEIDAFVGKIASNLMFKAQMYVETKNIHHMPMGALVTLTKPE